MKIAMIGHKRIPSREGGVEVVVEELATRMVKKGHDVTCYNRGGKHVAGSKFNNEELKEYKGVKLKKVITVDKKGLAAMTSSFFATIKALFSKAKVVHYHAEGPCAMMWIIKLFSNKKIIATIHGLDWQRAKWGGFATKYIKFGEKMAAKYADEIIVLSENVKKYFKDKYNRDTIFIPNGVNKPEIKKANVINEKYNLKKDNYILYLGRIVPEKGIHYLIEAFSKIKTDKKLVIAGGASDTDSYYSEVKELAKKDNRVILTGFVQGEELHELFSNAYIYCLPSDLEGMPLSLLEAMSYGNCCLTSNIDECSEVLEDKGVTFEKSNVKDLEDKLDDLIKNEEKIKKYKENAQEFILNKYNWDDVTDKTLELYEKNNNNNKSKLVLFMPLFFLLIFLLNFINIPLFKIIIYAITYISMAIFLLAHKKFQILSIPILFTIYHAVYIGICPVFLMISSYMSPDNQALQELVNSSLFLDNQLTIILISFFVFLVTILITEKFVFSKQRITEILSKQKKIIYSKKICILMLIVAFAFLFIYVFKNSHFLFSGDLETGRIKAMAGNGVFLYGMWLGTMSLSMLFESMLRKDFSKFVFWPLCILYAISILLLGFRSRIVTLCILMLLIYNRYHKIKFKKIIMIGLGLILLVGCLGVLRDLLSGVNDSSLFRTIVNLFHNGAININYVLECFPENTPFQYGNTFLINLRMLLPGPDVDFTIWLKEVLELSFAGGGVTPTVLGEFYINFGYIGIMFGFIIVGILVNLLDRKYSTSKNIYYVSFLIWCLLSSVRGGFSNSEINFILYSIVYFILIKIFKRVN